VGIQQSMAFARGEFREAQADIGQGDASAILRQPLDEGSHPSPDGELPGIGQPGYAPQQAGCEPGDSVPNPLPNGMFKPAGFERLLHGASGVACSRRGDYCMKCLCYYRRKHQPALRFGTGSCRICVVFISGG
jgi:hypothetical protein